MRRPRELAAVPEPEPQAEGDEPPPRRAVVVVGQSWLGMFTVLQAVEVVPDDVDLYLCGSPGEETAPLAAAIDEEQKSRRVKVWSDRVAPGVENRLRRFIGPRPVAIVVSASEDPGEQRVARELARGLGSPVWGATCAAGGWAGPDIPGFFGPRGQRPAVAMRLARALTAITVDAVRADAG